MNYYFPGSVDSLTANAPVSAELQFTVNSGKNALRLLLRNLSLEKRSKVAIPAFVCAAVGEAVKEEGLEPIRFDLYPKSYWTLYSEKFFADNNIRAVVLAHLYGFLHPDTSHLTEFCLRNNIKLIHDAAQTYGVDENILKRANGILYSFGPGKTLTGAGGGWIKGIGGKFYSENCTSVGSDNASKQFLRSRIYGYKPGLLEKISSIVFPAPKESGIKRMSNYALRVNSYVLSQLASVRAQRKKNYDVLSAALPQGKGLSVAYDDKHGQYFKLVLLNEGDPAALKKHLTANEVPYFCLGDSLSEISDLENYNKWRRHIVEISSEASLPVNEIQRVANVLKNFA